jgi:2-oxoglutarate ferredoxin oxidoreductase subunit alpha
MVYVGVLAQIIGIDLNEIHQALDVHFKGKSKAIESNFNVVKAAAEWAKANHEKRDPYWVEKMDGNKDLIMADGNTAAALGAIYGGVQFLAWYPITPASSLAESVNEYLPLLRRDPDTGKDTAVVVQAEDEIAAAGMTTGAGWAGLRAMTSTSGPGFSLMTEYAGLAYFTEVPIVIWDVQRIGPSTGLPTRTGQGDLTMAYFLGHGDTHFVILIPGSVAECFEFGWRAFDLAEYLQTPVIVLSDLDLGMNQWMTTRFQYPDERMERGKILWEEDLEKRKGEWSRYKDVDGDGVAYRTVMGNRHHMAAYFTRGTGHDENARYSEDPVNWENNMTRLKKKFETAKTRVPRPVIELKEKAEVGIITSGSAEMAVKEARAGLENTGLKTDYMRVRALPFSPEVLDFVRAHDRNYVVELNQDGQLHQLLTLAIPERSMNLISAAHTDGLPLSARWITGQILSNEEKHQ